MAVAAFTNPKRTDRRCGKGWQGEVGDCKRAKIKGAATLAKSAATWGAGKVVGGAVAGIAQQHGIPGPIAARIAESATQALFNTALNGKGKNAQQLATDFISESISLWAGKDPNTVDDGIAGGDEHVKALADFALSTSASLAAQRMKRQSNTLAHLLKRPEMRLDATEDVAEAVMDLTIVGALMAVNRQREDRACKPPWKGTKGQCRRAKAKGITIHGGEMVAAWAVGKVAGGAIAQLAVAHGVPHEVAKVVAESSLQALSYTAIHAARHRETPKKLAGIFVTQAAGAAAGKVAHGEIGGLTASANPTVHSLSSLAAGKSAGIGTVQALEKNGRVLQGLISRMRGRADAKNSEQLSNKELQVLMELSLMGVMMATKAKRRTDDATPVKRIIKWNGFEIGLQYLPFEKRHGRVLPAGYGHFRRTRGADGMAVDVYVGTNLASLRIFVVDQMIDGVFDEEKMIIGVNDATEARAIYSGAMPEEFFGGMREINLMELQQYRVPEIVRSDARPRRRRLDNTGAGKECGASHISANKTCHVNGSGSGSGPLGKIELEKVITNKGTPENFKPSEDMQRLASFFSGSDLDALEEWRGEVSDKGLQKKIDLADKSIEVMQSYGINSLDDFDDKRDELLQTLGTSEFDKKITAPEAVELHERIKASGADIDELKSIAEEYSKSEAKNWLKEAQEFDDSEEALDKAQRTYDLGTDADFRKKYRAFAQKDFYKLAGDASDELMDTSSLSAMVRSKETAQRLLDPDYKAFEEEFDKKAAKIADETLDLAFDWLWDSVRKSDVRNRKDAKPRRRTCSHECECDRCHAARKDALEALLRLDAKTGTPCNNQRGWVGTKPGCKRAKPGTAARVRRVGRKRVGKSPEPPKATVKRAKPKSLSAQLKESSKKVSAAQSTLDRKLTENEAILSTAQLASRKMEVRGKEIEKQLSLLPEVKRASRGKPVRSQKNAAKRRSQGVELRVIEGGQSDKSLEQLFQEADRIGSKYQSSNEPADLTVRRRAKKKANDIVDKAMGRATKRATKNNLGSTSADLIKAMGETDEALANLKRTARSITPKQRKNLTSEFGKKIKAVRAIKDPDKRAAAARELSLEAEKLESRWGRDQGLSSIRKKTARLSREMFGRTKAPEPKRANKPIRLKKTQGDTTQFRAPDGGYFSIDSEDWGAASDAIARIDGSNNGWLTFFNGRRTAIATPGDKTRSKAATAARKKLRRGGPGVNKVRRATDNEQKLLNRGEWVRSGPNGEKTGYSPNKKGMGPAVKRSQSA